MRLQLFGMTRAWMLETLKAAAVDRDTCKQAGSAALALHVGMLASFQAAADSLPGASKGKSCPIASHDEM